MQRLARTLQARRKQVRAAEHVNGQPARLGVRRSADRVRNDHFWSVTFSTETAEFGFIRVGLRFIETEVEAIMRVIHVFQGLLLFVSAVEEDEDYYCA